MSEESNEAIVLKGVDTQGNEWTATYSKDVEIINSGFGRIQTIDLSPVVTRALQELTVPDQARVFVSGE